MSNKINPEEHALYEVILQLDNVNECFAFFHDLCTPAELNDMTERWKVARLLYQGDLSYRQIHTQTGISLATITRVARFLNQESFQGYTKILKRLHKN